MPERYVVREVHGRLNVAVGSGSLPAGLTAQVHDEARGGVVVALFRSEDYLCRGRRHAEMLALARADAAAECDRLNAKHGPFPSDDAA